MPRSRRPPRRSPVSAGDAAYFAGAFAVVQVVFFALSKQAFANYYFFVIATFSWAAAAASWSGEEGGAGLTRTAMVAASLFVLGVVNLYFGRQGFLPLDQSISFDGGWYPAQPCGTANTAL